MALKWLVHAEVASTLAFTGVKLENLEETLITTNCDVSLLLIPSDRIHWGVNTNLNKMYCQY
jgi:hypothetical protein